MMREVLERRFARALAEREDGGAAADWPDMVLIDGGAGQYSAARAVLDDLGVTDVTLVAIAKGPDRDAGREWFFTAERPPFQLPPRDPVLYYLQRLRDEAHRFAITTHRAGRSKALVHERAGRGAGHRRGAEAGAAEPFRVGARGQAGGVGGFAVGAWGVQDDRRQGVRAFPSGVRPGASCEARGRAGPGPR